MIISILRIARALPGVREIFTLFLIWILEAGQGGGPSGTRTPDRWNQLGKVAATNHRDVRVLSWRERLYPDVEPKRSLNFLGPGMGVM